MEYKKKGGTAEKSGCIRKKLPFPGYTVEKCTVTVKFSFFLYSLTFRNEISQIHTKREDWKSRRLKECVKGDKKSLGLNICNTIKLQK